MKTLIKKSVKTFKLTGDDNDYVLTITISTDAQVNTNVRYLATINDLYDGSDDVITVDIIQGKRLRIRHIFDFSGINDSLLDPAMQHTSIMYTLRGQDNMVLPFEKNTKADLSPMKRIISVKVINIK
ncbi:MULTISPECIES: hypothetical protein [Chryseobacterium]|uniref:Uncharacterized protein n=1 Tax=Chryseobacterium pennae TaxID=2258962 RepID=A0A3D9C193_9FLAO|nr:MULTISPECIES: hypothetical protein [Chryseobacterium]MCS4302955.1 hypothetical protein [Chryseobacterium sp. BIGb0232]REC59647.1 hypothetical protein DRF65_24955 [Chryseobacterium pennae]ROS14753.1 hypothetical protein EDF65_3536 [Chryseobacterium nakagawai]